MADHRSDLRPAEAWRWNHFASTAVPRCGLGAEWVARYIAQRKRGLLAPLLRSTEGEGAWWIATTPINLWGQAELVPVEQIRERILAAEAVLDSEIAEAAISRIPPQAEKGPSDAQRNANIA